jgi:drug/metabolite transporter (DMT)-like permease
MSMPSRITSGNPNRERPRALVMLLLAAFLWSLGGVLIKSVHWHPMAIAGMRSAIAAVLIRVVFRDMTFTWSFDQVGGAVAYALTVLSFVVANKMTTAANVILLQYTAPIHAALFGAWFLRERATRLDWATILFALAGMALFFLDRLTTAGFWGNIVALGSGLSYGWLALFLRRQKSGSPMESVFLGNVLAALAGLPFMFGSVPGTSDWIGLLLLGVVQLGLPYILFAIAIRHVSAVEALLIPMIEPVLNPLWAFLFLAEVPGRMSLLGGLIILGSVVARGTIPLLRAEPADPTGK